MYGKKTCLVGSSLIFEVFILEDYDWYLLI